MFLFGQGKNKQLNELLNRIQMNFENNYKDAAQLNLKEYQEVLSELEESGKIKEKGRPIREIYHGYYKFVLYL